MARMLMLAAAALLAVSTAFAQQDARELFERARLLDDNNENLTEAIRLYGDVAKAPSADRPLAARAQYRIGVLYQRLGRSAEAQRAFREVVARYPDQAVAERARAKIAARRQPPALIVKSGPSPDGSYSETFTVAGETALMTMPDPARHRLYLVTCNYRSDPRRPGRSIFDPSTLIALDTDTNDVVRTMPLGEYVAGLAMDAAAGKLYATAQHEGRLEIIDLRTFNRSSIPIPGYPTGVDVNPVTGRVYVSSQGFAGNDKLFAVDGNSGAVSPPRNLGSVGGSVVVNPATNRVYAISAPTTRVFDGSDLSPITDLQGFEIVIADPISNRLFARTYQEQTVEVLDGNSHAVLASFAVPTRDVALAFDRDRERLFVGLLPRDQLMVIDTRHYAELGRYQLPEGTRGVSVDAKAGRAYASHRRGTQASLGIFSEGSVDAEVPETVEADGWSIIPGWGNISLDRNTGHLHMRIGKRGKATSRAAVVHRFRGDHWTLEFRSSYSTGPSGGTRAFSFGVLIGAGPESASIPRLDFGPNSNAMQVMRIRDDWNGCCPGEVALHFYEEGKNVAGLTFPTNASETYLWRITRDGRKLSVERSDDGVTYSQIGSQTFGPQVDGLVQALEISFSAYSDTDASADFDGIRLTPKP